MDSQQCQVCGEVFVNTDVVLLHIDKHTKKEIYNCLVSLKSSLEIFMKQYFSLKQYMNSNLIEKNDTELNGDGLDTNFTIVTPHRSHRSHVNTLNDDRNASAKRKNLNFNSVSGRKMLQKGDNHLTEDVVDLTNVEVKSEKFDMDSNLEENVTNKNILTEENSFIQNEFTDEFESVNEMTENQKCTKAFPVSIIDLSQSVPDHSINSKPEQLNIHYSESESDNTAMFINQHSDQIASRSHVSKVSHLSQIGKFVSDTTCSECGRTFATKFVLRRHMMSHTGERTHLCPICGKGFIGKQNMMVHVRVHTGEKPYKCPYCGQQFSQYGTLYRHKKRHQAAGDVR